MLLLLPFVFMEIFWCWTRKEGTNDSGVFHVQVENSHKKFARPHGGGSPALPLLRHRRSYKCLRHVTENVLHSPSSSFYSCKHSLFLERFFEPVCFNMCSDGQRRDSPISGSRGRARSHYVLWWLPVQWWPDQRPGEFFSSLLVC